MENKQAIRLLFLANSISGFSQGISMLSIPWYFTNVLRKPALFGKTYAILTLLVIVWMIFSGTIIDRYPRKKIFMTVCIIGALILGCISMLGYYLGAIPDAMVLVAFMATIFIFTIHYPTLYGFGQEITSPENYSRINSYIEIQAQFTSMLAGGMAAILLSGTKGHLFMFAGYSLSLPFSIHPWPMHKIFLLDALTYVAAFLIISRIKYTPIARRNIDTGHIFQRLQMGFRYLKTRIPLAIFGNSALSILVVVLVHEFYLLTIYVTEHLKATAAVYAGCQLFYSLGAVVAGLSMRTLIRKVKIPTAVPLLILTGCVFIFILAFTKSIWITFLFSAVLGLTNAGTRILRITYLFQQVPNDLIGRTNSVFSMSHTLYRAIFLYTFSLPFFQGVHITYAYIGFGIYTFAAGVVLLGLRKKLQKQ